MVKRKSFSELQLFAVLLNGGHLVWVQPSGPGSSKYKLYLPGGSDPDRYVGRITESLAEKLWKMGFLKTDRNYPQTTDKYGNYLTVMFLDTPSLDGICPYCEEVTGDD